MNVRKAISIGAPLLFSAAAISSLNTARADTPGMYASATSPGFFDRSGWYVGLDLGGAFHPGADNWNGNGFTDQVVGRVNRLIDEKGKDGAITGGIYGGYQYKWQDYPLVSGVEADFNGLGSIASNSSATYHASGLGFAPAGKYTLVSGRSTNFFGTIRGHFGYVPTPDMEIYISGGFAYAGNGGGGNSAVYYQNPNTGVVTAFKGSGNGNSRTGSAFGGGFSYALMDNLAVRLEAIYINLKSNDHTFNLPGGGSYSIDENFKFHFTVVRAGVTYKF